MSDDMTKLLIQVGIIVLAWNTTGYEKVNFLREMDRLEKLYKKAVKAGEKPADSIDPAELLPPEGMEDWKP